MNPVNQEADTIEHDEPEADQSGQAQSAAAPPPENPLTKFDPATLKGIRSSAMVDPGVMAFMPQNMAEAMEFSKLMACSNFVPKHLRNKPGDCLAVVLQSARWGADPYAVGNKTYFVNDRMAFEAQLVNAVVNSSKVLDGRLQISWQGEGNLMQCTVRGRIKGDADIHELIQELATITTRNSPLWKQSPKVQLAYYTSRAWARLYTPEVLLGIYTPDELETLSTDGAGAVVIPPPRPTRESTKAEQERARQEDEQRSSQFRDATADARPAQGKTIDHDPATGEVQEPERETDGPGQSAPPPETQQPAKASDTPAAQTTDYATLTRTLVEKIEATSRPKILDAVIQDYVDEIELLRNESAPGYDTVQDAIKKRRAYFAR